VKYRNFSFKVTRPFAMCTCTLNYPCELIIPYMSATFDGVWIGNWIYWPLIHTRLVTTLHTSRSYRDYCSQSVRAFTTHCLVTVFNGGLSPYSGFLNYRRALSTSFCQQRSTMTETAVLWPIPMLATISHQTPSLLFTARLSTYRSNSPGYNISARTEYKAPFRYCSSIISMGTYLFK
jgi:hypothetical protein